MPDGLGVQRTASAKPRLSIGPAELETFLAIAELGSFSKAAERLCLAQPSITNRVQRLERALRARLFERTTRAVVLTAAGERLRDRVGPIIDSLHAVLEEFHAEAGTRSQSVVVATSPVMAALLFPQVISRFAVDHPAIRVELQEHVTADLPSNIRSETVDFALIAQKTPVEGLVFERIITDRFLVLGPRGHVALAGGVTSVEDLTRHPFLLLAAYTENIAALSAEITARGLSLPIVRTAKNNSTLLGLVGAGMGLTLLPSIVLRLGGIIGDPRFEVASLDGVRLTRDYGIASLAGHDWSPGAKAFAAALRAGLLAQSGQAEA